MLKGNRKKEKGRGMIVLEDRPFRRKEVVEDRPRAASCF